MSEIRIRHHPLKRIFDVSFSLVVLLICTPLLILIALGIRLFSRTRVFYAQKRIGRGGKEFLCYKFRTMVADAEERLPQLLAENLALAVEWEKTHKLRNDPRITRLGRFLRKTSLDELPQFFNVLRGDLSVVGPRPVVMEEALKHFGKKATLIWQVRPGITGLWQISGRSDVKSYRRRLTLEEFYVRNRTFWLDLVIIVKTIPVFFFPRGAY